MCVALQQPLACLVSHCPKQYGPSLLGRSAVLATCLLNILQWLLTVRHIKTCKALELATRKCIVWVAVLHQECNCFNMQILYSDYWINSDICSFYQHRHAME